MQHRTADVRPTICHVLHTLQVGGGEVLARNFAAANSSEFRPVFAVLDEIGSLGKELRKEGYLVEVIGRRAGFDIACAARLGSFFRSESVAIVHAHQYGPLLYSSLARLPSRRIPILLTEHGRDFPDYRRWKRVLANRMLLTRKDRFVAVGQHVRNALIQFEGLPPARVQVVHNGRELRQFMPMPSIRDRVRKELGLPQDAFIIIQVARLNRLKDHGTALRAMARVATQVANAILLVVGDGEERENTQSMISDMALAGSVRMLGERSDVAELLQAADAFLLTSISEGIPLTLIEAMAAALPCVATRVGGVPEIVSEGETGLLAAAGDDRELSRHIVRLAADPTLRARFGHRARERVLCSFDERTMHDAYRRLYRAMLPKELQTQFAVENANAHEAALSRI
jgi:glycosyltransferase involved in cell wall biosynthesis